MHIQTSISIESLLSLSTWINQQFPKNQSRDLRRINNLKILIIFIFIFWIIEPCRNKKVHWNKHKENLMNSRKISFLKNSFSHLCWKILRTRKVYHLENIPSIDYLFVFEKVFIKKKILYFKNNKLLHFTTEIYNIAFFYYHYYIIQV